MASDQGRRDAPGSEPDDAYARDSEAPHQWDLEEDPRVAARRRDSAGDSAGDPTGDSGEDWDDTRLADERGRGIAVRAFQASMALLAVGAFFAVVWYAYTWGTERAGGAAGGGLPVVEAPEGPEKIAPDDPGGMDVPHQDKVVLNEGEAEPEVERLLPPPETPQPPEPLDDAETARADQAGSTDSAATPDAGGAGAADLSRKPAATSGEAPAGDSGETAGGGSDGDDRALPEREVAELPETAVQDGGTADAASEPEAADGAAPEPAADAEPSEAADAADAADAAQPSGQRDDGAYAVQLAAFRDEAGARAAWSRFQQRYPELLREHALLLQSVEIEGRGTFWRVRAGPFRQRSDAAALCTKLEDRGQDCLAVGR
jgi:cell division septation protein DedD